MYDICLLHLKALYNDIEINWELLKLNKYKFINLVIIKLILQRKERSDRH